MRKRHLVYISRTNYMLRYGIGISHSGPGGAPIHRDHTSWRTINGVWVNWPSGQVWLLFRRPSTCSK